MVSKRFRWPWWFWKKQTRFLKRAAHRFARFGLCLRSLRSPSARSDSLRHCPRSLRDSASRLSCGRLVLPEASIHLQTEFFFPSSQTPSPSLRCTPLSPSQLRTARPRQLAPRLKDVQRAHQTKRWALCWWV